MYLILFDIAEQGPQRPSDQLPERCREPKLMLYILHRAHFQQLELLFGDLRVEDVDWLGVVVEAGRLEDNRNRPKDTSQRKNP